MNIYKDLRGEDFSLLLRVQNGPEAYSPSCKMNAWAFMRYRWLSLGFFLVL